MKRITFLAFVVIAMYLFNNCNDTIITAGKNIIFPDSNISYLNHVQPLLRYTCAYPGCHDGTDPPNMYDWFELRSAMQGSLVVQGDPDHSRLIYKIENVEPHFPTVYWDITDNQKRGLRKWILEGAQNN